MKRHYDCRKLRNSQPFNRLGINVPSIWEIPPYALAEFSGELIKVMAEAAEQYIAEKYFSAIKKDFRHEAMDNQNPS